MKKQITLSLEVAKRLYGKSDEMNAILLENFTELELGILKLPKSWDHLKNVQGWIINGTAEVVKGNDDCFHQFRQGRFSTEKQAKSALAMAQLSQLIKAYNEDWTPDWTDLQPKYCICLVSNKIKCDFFCRTHYFLAFKTADIRDEFLHNFKDLINEYFMID